MKVFEAWPWGHHPPVCCSDGVPGCVVPHGPPLPAMRASGGWCAPSTPLYDLFTHVRSPWLLPDRPWARDVDVTPWLFPRLARIEHRARDYRRRVRSARRLLAMAWRALWRPQVDNYDDQEGYP